MISFKNDYSTGAHPLILQALLSHNLQEEEGYGYDIYTQSAITKLQEYLGSNQADIHLLVGGTQTNMIALAAFLRPHEAIIATESAHIAVHETGAIEATGHKIITVASDDGKLSVEDVAHVLKIHEDEHMVKPRLVKISNTTELGTVYTKTELKALSNYCKAQNLLFYMDGARLGSALQSEISHLSLKDCAQLFDAFYIGATKNGALMGEALVIMNDTLKIDFRYILKQRGGLLAKGRVLGIQFDVLFSNHLYFKLAQHANDMAKIFAKALQELNYEGMTQFHSNQIFPILPKSLVEKLKQDFSFIEWKVLNEQFIVIRLVTSWSTKIEDVQFFIKQLQANV